MVTETLFLCGMMLIAFVLGSMTTLIGSWMQRRAYTNEPLFVKTTELDEPEVEEEIEIPETDEERERREGEEFSQYRGLE